MATPRSGSTTTRWVGPPARNAAQHLLDDGQRVLVAGVVGREEGQVAQVRRRRAHQGALGPVPVPAAAEDAEHPARRGQPARLAEHDLRPAGVCA